MTNIDIRFYETLLSQCKELGWDILNPSYPFNYWYHYFDILEELMFAEDSISTLRKIYYKIYPIAPIPLLNGLPSSQQGVLRRKWLTGFIDIFKNVISILEDYEFYGAPRKVFDEFGEIVYNFYRDRIEWCRDISGKYEGPDNRQVIGLPGMTLMEYSDPYYFPWDGEFSETESYEENILKFLEVLMLPLENVFHFLDILINKKEKSLIKEFLKEISKDLFLKPLQVFEEYEVEKRFSISKPMKYWDDLFQLTNN
jgi:hypothetical protein